jgi:hypothetical protein
MRAAASGPFPLALPSQTALNLCCDVFSFAEPEAASVERTRLGDLRNPVIDEAPCLYLL